MKTFTGDGHVGQEALLLLLENELEPEELRRAKAHLHACLACRDRLASLNVAEAQLAQAPLPSSAAARERLQTAMAMAEPRRNLVHRIRQRAATALRPALLLRAASVVALLLVAFSFRQVTGPLGELMGAYEDTGPEPDHTLTPGSVVPLTITEVCQRSDDDLDPAVSPEMQRAVFRAYRMSERTAREYQVDYLINPQLGGDSSLQNLWPEPYHATVWNASAKDALETRLHGMVCGGQIGLQEAQQELAGDWIAAYKRYFHATRPIRTVASVTATTERTVPE